MLASEKTLQHTRFAQTPAFRCLSNSFDDFRHTLKTALFAQY